MKIQFKTDRLHVHHWQPTLDDAHLREDLVATLEVLLTKNVLQFLPPPLQLAAANEDVAQWIDQRAAEADVLLVDQRAKGITIGLVLLAPDPEHSKGTTLHIGYLLAESTWGKGVASELLIGLVDTLTNAGVTKLVGGNDKANPASARVLQKAGFRLLEAPKSADSTTYILDIS